MSLQRSCQRTHRLTRTSRLDTSSVSLQHFASATQNWTLRRPTAKSRRVGVRSSSRGHHQNRKQDYALEQNKSLTSCNRYIPNAATPALRRIAIKLALLHHRLHGSMSLEDIANAATAAEPSLTTDESDLLKQSVGFLDSMFNKERPPQSVTTSIVRSVVPPIVTQLNIIRKDGTVMMGDGKPSIYVF